MTRSSYPTASSNQGTLGKRRRKGIEMAGIDVEIRDDIAILQLIPNRASVDGISTELILCTDGDGASKGEATDHRVGEQIVFSEAGLCQHHTGVRGQTIERDRVVLASP